MGRVSKQLPRYCDLVQDLPLSDPFYEEPVYDVIILLIINHKEISFQSILFFI